MHNSFNHNLIEVLGLDRMLKEFTGDVSEISELLQQEYEQKRIKAERRAVEAERKRAKEEYHREKRFWILTVFGGAILAALSVSTFVKQLLEQRVLLQEIWDTHFTMFGNPSSILEHEKGAEFFGVLTGFLVMILTCIAGYLRRPIEDRPNREDKTEGVEAEAAGELIIHEARGE